MAFKEGSAHQRRERKRVRAGGSCCQWESADTRESREEHFRGEWKENRGSYSFPCAFSGWWRLVWRARRLGGRYLKDKECQCFLLPRSPFGLPQISAFRSTFLSPIPWWTETWLSFGASLGTPSHGLVSSLPRFQRWGLCAEHCPLVKTVTSPTLILRTLHPRNRLCREHLLICASSPFLLFPTLII